MDKDKAVNRYKKFLSRTRQIGKKATVSRHIANPFGLNFCRMVSPPLLLLFSCTVFNFCNFALKKLFKFRAIVMKSTRA